MGLIGANASVDTTPLDEQVQQVSTAVLLMNALQRGRVKDVEARVKQILSAPQDLPALPFIWSSDPAAQNRGRRGYFAKLKREGKYNPNGGRHERTGDLERATEVHFYEVENGGFYQLENGAPGAEFVITQEKQVPSHYLTGWQTVDEAVEKEAATLSLQIQNDWYTVNGAK